MVSLMKSQPILHAVRTGRIGKLLKLDGQIWCRYNLITGNNLVLFVNQCLFFLPVNKDDVISSSYNPEVTVFVFIAKTI